MTYKESEFPQLLEILIDFKKKKIPLEEVVSQAYKLYKRVPIYIGIVGMCLENFVSEVSPDKVKKGDTVVIIDKNNIYQGKIQSVCQGKVQLKNMKVTNIKKSGTVSLRNKKIFVFNYNVLEKLWPSLSFKKNRG